MQSVLEYSQLYGVMTIQTRNIYLYRVGENLKLDLFFSFTRSFLFFFNFWLHWVLIVAQGFLIVVSSFLEENRFRLWDSVVVWAQLLHSIRIFLDQRLYLYPRHWQVDHNHWTTRQILKLDVDRKKKLFRMFCLNKCTYFTQL